MQWLSSDCYVNGMGWKAEAALVHILRYSCMQEGRSVSQSLKCEVVPSAS